MWLTNVAVYEYQAENGYRVGRSSSCRQAIRLSSGNFCNDQVSDRLELGDEVDALFVHREYSGSRFYERDVVIMLADRMCRNKTSTRHTLTLKIAEKLTGSEIAKLC